METVNPNFDVQVASQKLISNWNALFSNRAYLKYLCTIYKRFQEISKVRLYGKAYRYSITFVLVTELSGRTFLYSL